MRQPGSILLESWREMQKHYRYPTLLRYAEMAAKASGGHPVQQAARAWLARREQDRAPDFVRASGDVVCNACGKKYYDHPMDRTVLSWNGEPFLNVLCDGSRVKL